MFLNIRAKSIGEIAKFRVFCPEDKVTLIPVEIDLTKVEVQVDDNHTNNVLLDEKRQLGLVLNYPTMQSVPMGVGEKFSAEQIFSTIISCIDYIYEGEQIHKAKDSSKAELEDFFNSLNTDQFQKSESFLMKCLNCDTK